MTLLTANKLIIVSIPKRLNGNLKAEKSVLNAEKPNENLFAC